MPTATDRQSSKAYAADFRGLALPRSAGVFLSLAEQLGCEEAVIRAVVAVEAAGSGFLSDGRPKILFERHKFSGATAGKHDRTHPRISSRRAGGYAGGSAEYKRLAEAIALDEPAAIASTSWGLPQIMGFNHKLAGYASASAMICDFCRSEDAQLVAFAAFVRSTGLVEALRSKAWQTFARGFNGAGFAANQYDLKLAAAYATAIKAAQHDRADLRRAGIAHVQAALNAAGYGPLTVDGWDGAKTRAAVRRYQAANKLPVDGIAEGVTRVHLFPQRP